MKYWLVCYDDGSIQPRIVCADTSQDAFEYCTEGSAGIEIEYPIYEIKEVDPSMYSHLEIEAE